MLPLTAEALELFSRLRALGVTPEQAAHGVRNSRTGRKFVDGDITYYHGDIKVIVTDVDYEYGDGLEVQVRQYPNRADPCKVPQWVRHAALKPMETATGPSDVTHGEQVLQARIASLRCG